MKVLYIHQYFRTPAEGGSVRSYYLSKELVKKGFEVEMITTHNHAYYEEKEIEGVKVHLLPIYYANELPYKKRVMAFLKISMILKMEKNFPANSTKLLITITEQLGESF